MPSTSTKQVTRFWNYNAEKIILDFSSIKLYGTIAQKASFLPSTSQNFQNPDWKFSSLCRIEAVPEEV